MCLQGSGSAGKHTALSLEFSSFGQCWYSHIVEVRQFLIDSGLNAHSLLMSSLRQRVIAFPAFCVLRITSCLKTLACRSSYRSNFPWWCTCREGPHTHRERQTNIQASIPSCFLCSEMQRTKVCLTHSWILWGHRILGLGGKIRIFLSRGPNAVQPSNCLKIHPVAVFFLLTELALLHPLGFLKQVGSSKLLAWGPLYWNVTLTRWPQYGTQPSQRDLHNLLPHGQYCYDLGMCLQGSESAGSHTALTLEFRSSEQAWRSHILEAKQLLQDRGLKIHSLWMPSLPQRKIAFPASCMLRGTRCWKALSWRSFFSSKVPWGPVHKEEVPHSQGTSKQHPNVCSISFPLQERSSEPRSVWNILGSCGDTPCVSTWILGLGGKTHIFFLGGGVSPNVVWLKTAWKSIQLLFSSFWQS